jgi:hypothetical protein
LLLFCKGQFSLVLEIAAAATGYQGDEMDVAKDFVIVS